MSFVHLHVHSYYSVLDGAAPIKNLFKRAEADNQPALAITDHGNMFGIKEFFKVAKNFPQIKPIIGCEVYVNPEGRFSKRGKEDQSANHLILLAKNLEGYYNLVKLVSLGYVEGFYYKPKIDKELLEKYHKGLICSSACLGGEIPQKIRRGDIAGAKESILWYKNLFGEDYYLEVQLHKTEVPGLSDEVYREQLIVNKAIFELAPECGVKVIATNDVHFASKEDGPAHDRLICINTNAYLTDSNRLRYTQQEYLKSGEQMRSLFPDHPEVIENTLEIAEKVERYSIDCDHILPRFALPEGFNDSNLYLKHLTYKGARQRYGQISAGIEERIEFELSTIAKMGFPDYFLIVQDFIAAARAMGVWVGPGRGSAAGSVVAYCLGITRIDPVKYDLLFERFLNPERISMPDIDIDFDDEGRGKVLQYVEQKYGKDHVSHVITFGTMAAKSAIKDIARIEQVPLAESTRLANLIPTKPFEEVVKRRGENGQEIEESRKIPATVKNCIERVPELKESYEHSTIPEIKETLDFAMQLEGCVRNTGVHACAVIIGRNNLLEHIPISIAKDKESGEDMWVSQYEGKFIEDVGMLKMDFLGLRTLSILKETVSNIKKHRGIELDIDNIPLDDAATYELFGRGETVATFQFESEGMQKWLRDLKPTRFEDLIAMNALYRPGPMDYIPDFVDRKHGRKKIEYDLPEMEEILKDTYGVTVYQEQVMLLSQKLAGFTKGEADGLRKAMGKKLMDKMMEMQTKFIEGGIKNGHPKEKLDKIWKDWTAFAAYAFNKSHATCYAWIGYQTAYLKANYPAEFMAANLSGNLNNIEDIKKLMEECRRMGISVLGPDINESDVSFTVNKGGNIRFGMAGVKGVGAAIVNSIIEGRSNGPYKNIFDFIERSSAKAPVNRKTIESLVYAGAFDSFTEIRREQFFAETCKGEPFLDALCRYGSKVASDSLENSASLFGISDEGFKPIPPEIPVVGETNKLEFLKKEKEMTGIYLSAHPLDIYKFEIDNFAQYPLAELHQTMKEGNCSPFGEKEFTIAGLVNNVTRKSSKSGRPYASFTIEDYTGSISMTLFGKDYENFIPYLEEGEALFLRCAFAPRFQMLKENGEEKRSVVGHELKLRRVSLLANIKEELLKSFTIVLSAENIDAPFRKRLLRILKNNKGKSYLSIKMLEYKEKIAVDLLSRKFTIDVTQELLDLLKEYHYSYTIE